MALEMILIIVIIMLLIVIMLLMGKKALKDKEIEKLRDVLDLTRFNANCEKIELLCLLSKYCEFEVNSLGKVEVIKNDVNIVPLSEEMQRKFQNIINDINKLNDLPNDVGLD